MKAVLLGIATASLALASPRSAAACATPPPPRSFEIPSGLLQASAEAPAPPLSVGTTVMRAERAERAESGACASTATCGADSVDMVLLSVALPAETDPAETGLRIRVVRGTAPAELAIEGDVAAPRYGEDLVFPGAGSKALDFTVAVSTLDRHGNESAPIEAQVSAAARPASRDDDGGGCAAAGSAGIPWLLGLAGLALLQRRSGR